MGCRRTGIGIHLDGMHPISRSAAIHRGMTADVTKDKEIVGGVTMKIMPSSYIGGVVKMLVRGSIATYAMTVDNMATVITAMTAVLAAIAVAVILLGIIAMTTALAAITVAVILLRVIAVTIALLTIVTMA